MPSRWRHEYSRQRLSPAGAAGLEDALRPVPIAAARPPTAPSLSDPLPRAVRAGSRPMWRSWRPSPTRWPAASGAGPSSRCGIPFGVQAYENIDRPLPAPGALAALARAARRGLRRRPLAERGASWSARGAPAARSSLRRPRCPGGSELPEPPPPRPFTVGYAGPAGAEQGARSICWRRCACSRRPVELLLIGNGELRESSRASRSPARRCACSTASPTSRWPPAYAQLDVLVLPSHTTPTWKEQFGRVIIEALWCGVPVVGSDSGEIPWLIGLTGGGLVFPEGDVRGARRQRSGELRADPGCARGWPRPGGRRSSGCSPSRRPPTRSSACCSAPTSAPAPARRRVVRRARGDAATIRSQLNSSAGARAAAPIARAQRRVGGELAQALGDRRRIAADQKAAATVGDQLADPVDGGREDRQPARRPPRAPPAGRPRRWTGRRARRRLRRPAGRRA